MRDNEESNKCLRIKKDMPLYAVVELNTFGTQQIRNDLLWCKSPNLIAENRVKRSKEYSLRGIKVASELSTTDKKDT